MDLSMRPLIDHSPRELDEYFSKLMLALIPPNEAIDEEMAGWFREMCNEAQETEGRQLG